MRGEDMEGIDTMRDDGTMMLARAANCLMASVVSKIPDSSGLDTGTVILSSHSWTQANLEKCTVWQSLLIVSMILRHRIHSSSKHIHPGLDICASKTTAKCYTETVLPISIIQLHAKDPSSVQMIVCLLLYKDALDSACSGAKAIETEAKLDMSASAAVATESTSLVYFLTALLKGPCLINNAHQ